MTDAALPVTERAVERFAEAYLTTLGAQITKNGRRWTVDLPGDIDTDLELDGAELEITDDPDEVGEGVLTIAPESQFVERMLDEAADRTPVGSLSITEEQVDIRLPPWLRDGPIEVLDKSFTPYYDRQAICALFQVGIETVSEYQKEELQAIAIDLDNQEQRPRLVETYLNLTGGEQPQLDTGPTIDGQKLTAALDGAQTILEEELASTVRNTREQATRAAEVELDEYQQFVRQRQEELADEIHRLTSRIEEVTDTIDTATDQEQRIDALRQRKRVQAELEDLRVEMDDLTAQIEKGFPDKRREIRKRHALTVKFRPVAITAVSYERGDLDLTLRLGDTTVSRSYAYAVGIGVTEQDSCDQCDMQLTSENPLTLKENRTVGVSCCGH